MKAVFRKSGVSAALLTLAFALTGCGGGQEGAEAAEGGIAAEALYKKQCISCHGEQLEGRVGPATNLKQVGARLSRDQIAATITNGKNGMPRFKNSLSETEIGALADWLAANK